ncbi:MAG: thermonuclease family protein, partial [Calditrichia bacterium]
EQTMYEDLYYYSATVESVYDGDTVKVNVDLGFKTWIHTETLRLARINAPELRGDERPRGLVSRDFLRDLILDKQVVIRTFKDKQGKYGRYLADIYLQREEEWINVNDLLVSEGYAVYQEY